MKSRSAVLFPSTERILAQLGEQIKLARLRRKVSVQLIAERAGISRATVWAVEKGSPTVSIGHYAQMLTALNMDEDLLLVAKDDELGRKLQDLELPIRKRAPKRTKHEQ
jgi:transcriptional regulator with XRE-family HTH domain